jgi:ribosomal-protein-alanine N-acetyltransferase
MDARSRRADDGATPATVRDTAGAPLVLRRATARDIEPVAAIERASFGDPWTPRSFRALLDADRVWFVVGERPDGRLAGYIVMWFLVDEAEIANLAVAPDDRGRRVGALLLDAAIAAAERRGIGTFYLEVRDSNRAARALYGSRGFEEIARRRRYYRAPVEDALVMRRRRVTADPARSS